ncbi:MAG: hypothetical protein JSR73_12120 [Proteobacteria bacterium]|nr:hypothetical protein [Pseudomonadota bacterium]
MGRPKVIPNYEEGGAAEGLIFVRAWRVHALRAAVPRDRIVTGQKQIAAALRVSVRQLRDLLNPAHPSYDYQMAAMIKPDSSGRYAASATTLKILGAGHAFDVALKRSRMIRARVRRWDAR